MAAAAFRVSEEEHFPTLDDAMRAHIETALSLAAGRIEGPSGAAALLGLNPHTLRGKMRRLAIDWSTFRHRSPRRSLTRP